MNLQHRLQYKTTATIAIISDTRCLYSDEISNNLRSTLSIVEAPTKKELFAKIVALAKAHATNTKFAPVLNIVTNDSCVVYDIITMSVVKTIK